MFNQNRYEKIELEITKKNRVAKFRTPVLGRDTPVTRTQHK